MNAPTFVYFIKPVGMDGPIKIGLSEVPPKRLNELAAWSPFPLEIIGTVPGLRKDERFLHRCFSDLHTHYEWFRWSSELRDAIALALAAQTIDVLRDKLIPKGDIRGWQQWRTPEQRRYFSYQSRVRWAEKRLRAQGENSAWYKPHNIDAIVNRYGRAQDYTLTPEHVAQLETYLAAPAAHSVVPPWREKGRAA